MKATEKQLLRAFIVLTGMAILTALIGSFMNYIFSCVFMCDFKEVQISPVWIFHGCIGLFFTVGLLSE